MPNPFFIVGPTAVGKSEIALEAAVRCNAEIINADAFQVYAGLDLLTAKPPKADRLRVPHHLLGTVPLSEDYHVARFLNDAQACMRAIFARARPVIVVGGSGLYVKALTHGLSPLPGSKPELRAELDALELPDLLARLQALDTVAAGAIDAQNKRRLVRAIEVCLTTGNRFSDYQTLWRDDVHAGPARGVFLSRPRTELRARIEGRAEGMFTAGVIEEVKAVRAESHGATSARMIGLAEIRALLEGVIGFEHCVEKIKAATRQYAKRQTTWFKRESVFEPIDLPNRPDKAVIRRIVDGVMSAYSSKTEASG